MRRRAGIVLALLLVLTGCTPAEPAGPAAEPAAEPVYMATWRSVCSATHCWARAMALTKPWTVSGFAST